MDQCADIEQLIEGEIAQLRASLQRLTEGPIPLRLWSKRAGGDLHEETEAQIAHLDRTIRLYEAVLADMNRREPGWREQLVARTVPFALAASAAS